MESVTERSGKRVVLAVAEQKQWQARLLAALAEHAAYRQSSDRLADSWQAARCEAAETDDETSPEESFNAQWLLRSREDPTLLEVDTLSPDDLAWRARSMGRARLADYVAALDSHLRRFGLMHRGQPAMWAREAVHANVSQTFLVPSSVLVPTRLVARAIYLHASLIGASVDVSLDLDPRSRRRWAATCPSFQWSAWDELEANAIAAVRAAVAEMRAAVQSPAGPSEHRVVRRYAGREHATWLACERLAHVLVGLDRVTTEPRRKQLSRFSSLVGIDPPTKRSTAGQK